MKVTILHQYFRTPDEGGGIRSYYLAKALMAAGHSVEVLTAWNQPEYKEVIYENISVRYLPVYYDNSLGFYKRVRSFVLFYLKAYRLLSLKHRCDLIYAVSTPLTTGLLALTLKRKKNIPYIFEIGDLWPDVPVQMGILKNPLLIRVIKKMEYQIYQGSRRLVAMSPPIQTYLSNLGFSDKTVTITNFADLAMGQNKTEMIGSLQVGPTRFRLTYAGAIGRANHLQYLLDLATEAVRLNITDFECCIMGDGAEKNQLIREASRRKLHNVRFLPHGSKAEAFDLIKSSDMVYLSFDNYNLLWTGSPNKYFDALAAGKPVLCNFGGWIGEEITKESCGYCYNPAQPEDFFEHIWPEIKDPKRLQRRAAKAIHLARTKYSPEIQLPLWLTLFETKPAGTSTE